MIGTRVDFESSTSASIAVTPGLLSACARSAFEQQLCAQCHSVATCGAMPGMQQERRAPVSRAFAICRIWIRA